MLPETIQQTLATADTVLQKALQESNLPGVAVALVYDGQPIYLKGMGYADVARRVPATPETVFRIASISKTFAAVALMQLWEQGKFDLHQPVNNYLRAFQLRHVGSQPITFHHLLTHTAGLGELAPLWRYLSPRAHFNVVSPNRPVPPLAALYGRVLPAERPAGEKWCYANNGYATIGQLVADISGQPFADYARRHIFAPLGMETADFWRSDRVKPRLAIGYSYKEKQQRFQPVPDLEQVTTAAGSMYASISDMARYLAALMQGGRNESGQMLKPETLHMMFTPQFQLDPRLQGMGYGFKVDDWGGQRVVSHDGLWLGFVSSMFVAPEAKLGVIALTNRAASDVIVRLARQLLQRALGYNPRPIKKRGELEPPDHPELWPELIGFYGPTPGWNSNFRLWQQLGGEFEVYVQEGRLHMRANWGGWRDGFMLKAADFDDPYAFAVGSTPIIFRRARPGQMQLLYGLNQFWQRPYAQSVRRKLDVTGLSKLIKRK